MCFRWRSLVQTRESLGSRHPTRARMVTFYPKHAFCWPALVIATIAFVAMSRSAQSYPLPSSNCDMSSVQVDPTREVINSEWCEITEQAPVINSRGDIRDLSGSTDTCDGCSPNCENAELPQPVGKSCTTLLSISFTDTLERSTTGGFGGQGGGWLAKIEANLETKIGYKTDNRIEIKRSYSVTIAPCTWQTEQIFMQVLYGKKMSLTATCTPCRDITDTKLKLRYEHHGVPQTATVSLTCNLGLDGNGTVRTVANGRCPRP